MAKNKTKKKDTVWVGVWNLEGDDPIVDAPIVFVSRTREGLDDQIYNEIKEYFDQIFGDDKVPKNKAEAIGEYFQRCSDRDIAEWLLTTEEEIQ